MTTAIKNNFASHPRKCNCPEHRKDAELNQQIIVLEQQMADAANLKDFDAVGEIARKMEETKTEIKQLRRG